MEAPRASAYRIRTVVIDAGHGGHDAGCLGFSSMEKHIALAIALKMGAMIEEKFTDVKVIYTRKTDVFIPLFERAAIANRTKADLFICIHCNAGGKAAYGVETYVMGLHKTADNLTTAKRENASILLEEDYKVQYDGFDPGSPEANIIFSLCQNQFMNHSLSFAAKVQNQFDKHAGRFNRGVKQAGFLVLYKTAMPSVLIETGFLTHAEEEKYLLSTKGQTTIATCIYQAFKEYKVEMEGGSMDETAISKNEPDKDSETPRPSIPFIKDSITADTVSPKDKFPTVKDSVSQVIKTTDDTIVQKNKVVIPVKKTPKTNDKVTGKNKIFFTVQIAASTNAAKDLPKYMHIKDIHSLKGADGFTRFMAGNFISYDEARSRQTQLKTTGYKDAFITAYNGTERITVNQAIELLK